MSDESPVDAFKSLLAGASRAIGFLLLFPMFSWFEIDTRMRLALGLILSAPTIAALFATSAFDTTASAVIVSPASVTTPTARPPSVTMRFTGVFNQTLPPNSRNRRPNPSTTAPVPPIA